MELVKAIQEVQEEVLQVLKSMVHQLATKIKLMNQNVVPVVVVKVKTVVEENLVLHASLVMTLMMNQMMTMMRFMMFLPPTQS